LRFRLSETVVGRLVRCFDSAFLLSLLRPAGFKVGKFSPPQIHRYLWYRQAAKVLGWRDRQKFPREIEELLKEVVWPDEAAELCGATSAVERRNELDYDGRQDARKGSSGKERQSHYCPGDTIREELGPDRGTLREHTSVGSETANSGIVLTFADTTAKRARECSTAPFAQAVGEDCTRQNCSADEGGRGWDSKRARLRVEVPRESP
jgi:hypothetical protein